LYDKKVLYICNKYDIERASSIVITLIKEVYASELDILYNIDKIR
jgi:hypothetical protein